MPTPVQSSVAKQREYYTETASKYDSMHAHEGVDDEIYARLLFPLLNAMGMRSLLDVGAATGRGLPKLAEGLPGAMICGVEPVEALVRQGVSSGATRGLPLLLASGDALPFADRSFDAVCEFSVLHHVAEPAVVVKEMLRVARRVVVISDSNRFGQGSPMVRVGKLLLWKLGLWGVFNFLRTGGKRYQVSEGDGVFYSYSVFDNYDLVRQWAKDIYLFPHGDVRTWSWFHPLLSSGNILLVAVRKDP